MRGLLLGADVVSVRDVEHALASFGDRYLARIYTPAEIAYARAAPSETARRLGARFAAKEATIKALRAGQIGIDPRTIEIAKAADGGTELVLTGAASVAARRAGAGELTATLSHHGDLAIAVVVGERAPSPPSRILVRARQRRTTPRANAPRGAHRP